MNLSPPNEREQGMPGARCTRGLVCKVRKENAHEHTGTAGALRHSLRNGCERCSTHRSGGPVVAGKRPDFYAMNYSELQAWIEMAHRPLIEVNDAARR